jgi:hypothetical protein
VLTRRRTGRNESQSFSVDILHKRKGRQPAPPGAGTANDAVRFGSLFAQFPHHVDNPVEAVSVLPKCNHRGICWQYKMLGNMGSAMKKFLIAVCSIVLAIGVSGCVGKAPVGKGKAPAPVVTRG